MNFFFVVFLFSFSSRSLFVLHRAFASVQISRRTSSLSVERQEERDGFSSSLSTTDDMRTWVDIDRAQMEAEVGCIDCSLLRHAHRA